MASLTNNLKLSITVIIVLLLLPLLNLTLSLPLQKTITVETKPNDIDYYLDEFLRRYYNSYIVPREDGISTGTTAGDEINNVDPWWEMQGDQPMPVTGGGSVEQIDQPDRLNGIGVVDDIVEQVRRTQLESGGTVGEGGGGVVGVQDLNGEYLMKMRKRLNESGEFEERAKDNWIQLLKQNILHQVGWTNYSTSSNPDLPQRNVQEFQPPNKTTIMDLLRSNGQENGNVANGPKFEGLVTEKIRSYYPQCELPKGTDIDLWKDEKILNLYYNLDISEGSVQAANLRLYRLINDSTTLSDVNCQEDSSNGEEEKILRVSAYWYLKPLKRQKAVKKRMCDSKVISEKANWIELNIKPALANWLRGRNAGLAIIVEDQDGGILKADQYFNGPSCQIGGASTPKPIPSFILDALRQPYDPNNGSPNHNSAHSLLGQDARAALASHTTLRLPSLDIKTSEAVEQQQENKRTSSGHLDGENKGNSSEDCDSAEQHQSGDGSQHLGNVQLRHTRHHHRHQHHQRIEETADPRNRMIATQIIWTNQQLLDLQSAHQRKNQKITRENNTNNSESNSGLNNER